MRSFAERLREERQRQGLTQEALAGMAGLSQSAIGNYESGERGSSRQIARLANALGVNALWLETGDGDKETGAPAEGIDSLSAEQVEWLTLLDKLTPQQRVHMLAIMRELVRVTER
jgi:transcriptional regulator with XRE-family HTH domain